MIDALPRRNGHQPIEALTAPLVVEPRYPHLRFVPVGEPERRTGTTDEQDKLDAELARAVRRASWMRQGFYVVVLIVAMAGQVTGAVEALHIPLVAAVPAVAALELGGIVVLANADVRRRLGEHALASRLLSVAIAAWAVAFNWLAHTNHLLGGFYAGMSALGYAVWLMHTENSRRDRLRATGDLPPTTPAYELLSHWLRHPLLTARAKSLAKANDRLGLYDSLAAARAEVNRERRTSAISKVLHREIRSAVDPSTADIAVAAYDLDEIAKRVAAGADYDWLTGLVAARLGPTVATVGQAPSVVDGPSVEVVDGPSVVATVAPSAGPSVAPVNDAPSVAPTATVPPSVRPVNDRRATVAKNRRSARPTVKPTATVATDGFSSVVTINAAELRRRYPDGLPEADWPIREATGWSPGRVKSARAAYEARADLNPHS